MLLVIISLFWTLNFTAPETVPMEKWEVIEVKDYSEVTFNIKGELHNWEIKEAYDDIIIIEYKGELHMFSYNS